MMNLKKDLVLLVFLHPRNFQPESLTNFPCGLKVLPERMADTGLLRPRINTIVNNKY
jgi:hypothetical protein